MIALWLIKVLGPRRIAGWALRLIKTILWLGLVVICGLVLVYGGEQARERMLAYGVVGLVMVVIRSLWRLWRRFRSRAHEEPEERSAAVWAPRVIKTVLWLGVVVIYGLVLVYGDEQTRYRMLAYGVVGLVMVVIRSLWRLWQHRKDQAPEEEPGERTIDGKLVPNKLAVAALNVPAISPGTNQVLRGLPDYGKVLLKLDLASFMYELEVETEPKPAPEDLELPAVSGPGWRIIPPWGYALAGVSLVVLLLVVLVKPWNLMRWDKDKHPDNHAQSDPPQHQVIPTPDPHANGVPNNPEPDPQIEARKREAILQAQTEANNRQNALQRDIERHNIEISEAKARAEAEANARLSAEQTAESERLARAKAEAALAQEREERARENATVRLPEVPKTRVRMVNPTPPAAPYDGPHFGTISWQGEIHGTELITIEDGHASSGFVTGRLPGVAVLVQPVNGKKVGIASPPAPENNFRSMVFRASGNGHMQLSFEWALP